MADERPLPFNLPGLSHEVVDLPFLFGDGDLRVARAIAVLRDDQASNQYRRIQVSGALELPSSCNAVPFVPVGYKLYQNITVVSGAILSTIKGCVYRRNDART